MVDTPRHTPNVVIHAMNMGVAMSSVTGRL